MRRLRLVHPAPARVIVTAVMALMVSASCATVEVPNPGPGALPMVDEVGVEPWRLAMVRPVGWDPISVALGDQAAVIMADLLYDGLTEIDATGALQPALATAWGVAHDGLTWRFDLDTDRTSPQEVVASLQRLQSEAPDSAAGQILANVTEIAVVDDGAVRLSLAEPEAGLAWLLSGVPFSVVGERGRTTGPYTIDTDSPASTTLVPDVRGASEEGEGADDGGTPITITWVDDEAAVVAALDSGQADAGVAGHADRLRASVQARSIVRYYGMNLDSPRLSDARVRLAVLAAVDRGEVAGRLTAPVLPADGLTMGGLAGYQGGVCAEVCGFDPDRARAVLAEVFPDGAVPTLVVGVVGEHQLAPAESLAAQLEAVGFAVVLLPVEAAALVDAVNANEVDLFSAGWIAPAGSVDAVLPPLLSAGSPVNLVGAVSSEVDALIAEARLTADDAARWALLDQAHRLTINAGAVLPVAAARNGFMVADGHEPVAVRVDGSIVIRSGF